MSSGESYAEMRRRVRLEAADRLEELTTIAKQVALDLRGDPDDQASQEDADLTAYGRVYWLRRQLGYVVVSLGGPRAPDRWVTKLAEREYGTSEDNTSADEGKK